MNTPPTALVPTSTLGTGTVPRVFLGDNGFLRKFGSGLTDEEVTARMGTVALRTNFGLAAGDVRLLRLARQVESSAGRPIPLMHHSDLPLTFGGDRIRYRRCGASLLTGLRRRRIDPSGDAVLGYLATFNEEDAFTESELERVVLSKDGLEAFGGALREYRPEVVTIGGDWLDMLLLADRAKYAIECVDTMFDMCRSVGAATALTAYVGALVQMRVPSDTDALLVPFNPLGSAMLPDPARAREWADDTHLPVIAMHILGHGQIDVDQALPYVESQPTVATMVIGASRPENIERLIRDVRGHFDPTGDAS